MNEPPTQESRPQVLDLDVSTACCEVIEPLIDEWLDSVDDGLFEMAEHIDDGSEMQLLDAVREIRHQRPAVIDRFLDSLDMACYRYAAGQPCVDWNSADDLRPDRDDDPAAELGYALSSLQAKGERRHRQALAKLYQRLGEIRGVDHLDHSASPVSPASLCGALSAAIGELELDDRSTVVVAKLFGRHFIDGLDGICEEILVALYRSPAPIPETESPEEDGLEHVIERGVRAASQIFSQVRGLVMRRQEAVESVQSTPEPTVECDSDTTAEQPADLDDSPETDAVIPEVDAVQEADTVPETEVEPEIVEQTISAEELQSALVVMQARALREEMDTAALTGLEAIRDELMAQIDRLWESSTRPVLSADHETAMELAGMVFEFIRDDESLRPSLQTLLARLQVPYVRVALLEPELFARPGHPARQLLDELAETAALFGDRSGVHDKMHEVVHRVLNDLEDDCTVFEHFLVSFGRYADHIQRSAEQADRKAAKVEEGRNRAREARKQAAKAIGERTRDTDLPEDMHALLQRPWVNAMALTWLRHGAESSEWRQALQFVDDLIWGLKPKLSAADVARLQSMMPVVARQLGNGLEEVAVPKAEIGEIFESMREIYRARLPERYQDALHLPDSFGRGATFLPRSRSVKAATKHPATAPVGADSDAKSDMPSNYEVWLEAVRGLQPGAWFDLTEEDGKCVRAKLSWVNPINATLLFVDQDGLKLANKSSSEFAKELQSGEATLLENVPLFERAMAAISERLRQERQRAG